MYKKSFLLQQNEIDQQFKLNILSIRGWKVVNVSAVGDLSEWLLTLSTNMICNNFNSVW